MLHEAEVIWVGRRERGFLPGEAENEAMFFHGQWLAQVLLRLSPESQAELLEMAQRLDDSERFERLVEPQ